MTKTQTSTTVLMPARRRTAGAVPVLIQIPDLAARRAPTRKARRRRLRREVRVAGCVLLILMPVSMAMLAFGVQWPARVSASSLTVDRDLEATAREVPAISLSLEPVAAAPVDFMPRVSLPGTLVPADPSEEAGDGGH